MTQPRDHEVRTQIRTGSAQTLFVEAGAGTGKTTALVARVVHLVATGHVTSMSQVATITFTENAAAELRNRIREGLQPSRDGTYGGQPYDEVERGRIAQGLAELDDAVLTTLHGFASRILSEAALEAGLPPGFSVNSGGDAAEQSWADFLDRLLDDAEVRPHLLHALTLGLKLSDLQHVAAALGGSWDRLQDRPLHVRAMPALSLHAVLPPLADALAGNGTWPDDGLGQHLRKVVEPFGAEMAALTDPLDRLDALSRTKLSCKAGKAPTWTKAGFDTTVIKAALQAADEARCALLAEVGAAVTETLAARVQDWLLKDADRRREAGTLDYHDLLVLARDVLRTDAGVRRRLHAQWPVLLVDEFQDTDPLQVEIVCLIAGMCDDEPGTWDQLAVEGGRLFFVGDAKQSIYRFRRADIDLFTAVGVTHGPAQRLAVNFRSVPGVLEAVNAAFGLLIGADADAGIDYADLEHAREAAGDGPPVLLLGGPRTEGSAAELRRQEAEHLADVAVRAERAWTVAGGRKAQYRDIAILLPTRTPLPTIERALQARGVPYRIESRSLVWGTDAVRGLVTLLQAVADPADEVALLAALRSPGLACSDVDLVTWRAAGGRWSLFADVPEGLDAEHPVASAVAVLRAWHEQRWWVPVDQLVSTVVRELRLVELTASQRRPRDHWRRLRFLVDQARAWCDDGGSGLASFVAWAVRQVEDDADVLETVVPEPDDDAVRILTVHGSKGLEFPITMVAGLGPAGTRTQHVLWTDRGPEVRFRNDVGQTAGWDAAAGSEKEQSRREAVRLLYVATTRAMDHLVIGCHHVPPRKSAAQQLWEVLSPGPLVRTETTVPPRVADDAGPGVELPITLLPDRDSFAATRAKLLRAVGLRVATSPTALTQIALAEQAAVNAGPADRTTTGEVATDESAIDETAIEPERPVEQGQDATPLSVQRRSSRKGAAIGTATHRVLELLDLRNPTQQEISALARLACAEQHVPELQADIEGRVWSALGSSALRDVLEGDGRLLSEVYLVVRDGERFLEGYVDLLVDDGMDLAVLDYKTDQARDEAARAAKREHYAPQLAAYARAVGQVTGREVTATDLVFAPPGGSPPHDR